LGGPSSRYNISSAHRLQGPLKAGALDTALSALIHHHELLRTRMSVIDGEPRQHVLAPHPCWPSGST